MCFSVGKVASSGAATFIAGDPALASVTCTATDPAGAFTAGSVTVSVTGAVAETSLGSALASPQRLAVDAMGDVYVAEVAHTIRGRHLDPPRELRQVRRPVARLDPVPEGPGPGAGDRAAAAELIERHTPAVYATCLAHLADTYGDVFKPTPELEAHKDNGQNWYPPNHFRPLVDAGHVYVAMPPLYRIDVGKQVFYALDDSERQGVLDRIETEKIKGKVAVTRFKGLGEMNPLQLRESSIDPNTRRLAQLTIEPGDQTFDIMNMLLSKKQASQRKTWLQEKGDLAEV